VVEFNHDMQPAFVNRDLPLGSNQHSVVYPAAARYIAGVTKRLLLTLLLAWLAIAPAIANSCATGCETMSASSAHHLASAGADLGQGSDVPDCHDASNGNGSDDTKMPDAGSMAAACFVAGAVSVPAASFAGIAIDVDSEYRSFVLLPSASFQTAPPNKPPQA
jgi:hypothetical protein